MGKRGGGGGLLQLLQKIANLPQKTVKLLQKTVKLLQKTVKLSQKTVTAVAETVKMATVAIDLVATVFAVAMPGEVLHDPLVDSKPQRLLTLD